MARQHEYTESKETVCPDSIRNKIEKKINLALYAINTITEFEIATSEKKAIQDCLPLFEEAFSILNILNNIVDVSKETKLNAYHINKIKWLMKYAETKIAKTN